MGDRTLKNAMDLYQADYEFSNTMNLYRDDYEPERAYYRAFKALDKHYGYKVGIEGGWKFFAYASDYDTFLAQR